MKDLILDLPTFGFIVGTRAALAFGLGLLLSSKFPENRRRAIGLTLVAIGAATTIPAAMSVRGSLARSNRGGQSRPGMPQIDRDEKLKNSERFPRKGDDNE